MECIRFTIKRIASLLSTDLLQVNLFLCVFFRVLKCIKKIGGCEDVNVAYGNSTVGEDLADLTGITLSYNAYFMLSDEGRAAPMGDKQKFFMILSQAFCESYDQEHKCEAVANDEHAIAEFRIDRSFRNIPAFQDAFGCRAGDAMYKSDACRVYG